jgi:sugar phosphate isomerase/epimerase
MKPLPFRIGTTSYIIPADILPNVHFLARKVHDIELVLFEVDDGPNNLPPTEVILELQQLADYHGLSYTVHLPVDLKLSAEGTKGELSLAKARKVIELTRPLNPWAYIVHLDRTKDRPGFSPADRQNALAHTLRNLEIMAQWAGGPEKLAIENLEGDDPEQPFLVLERIDVSRCVDIGHLWRDGHDPLHHLLAALPRTRVIHFHGVAERDHKSLAHMSPSQVNPVIAALLDREFQGVLTLEVFGEEDFHSSLATLQSSLRTLWDDA